MLHWSEPRAVPVLTNEPNARTAQLEFPKDARRGTVIEVPDQIVEELLGPAKY